MGGASGTHKKLEMHTRFWSASVNKNHKEYLYWYWKIVLQIGWKF